MPNLAPTSSNLSGDTALHTEGAASTVLDAGGNAAIADADSLDFGGGTLTVAITAGGVSGEDRLLVNAGGGVAVFGSAVSVGNVQIATYTGGSAGAPLVFALDPDATPQAVQTLIRAIAYANDAGDDPTGGNRTITWTLVDGDGTAGGGQDTLSVTSTIDVDPVNDAPVATIARYGGEAVVNTFTAGNQYEPAVASLGDAGYVVAWTSETQDASGPGVYVQRYNIGGVPQGEETLVATFAMASQYQPAVSGLSGGGFVVAWAENRPDADADVRVQRFDAAGAKQGSEMLVHAPDSGIQNYPSIAGLSNGGFVVVWESMLDIGGGVYMRRFDADGVAQYVDTRVNTYTPNTQGQAEVAALAGGGFVVVWSSLQDGSYNIYSQRYSDGGFPQGGETRISTFAGGHRTDPAIASLADGGYVVTWTSSTQDGSGAGVYMQRYDDAGAAQGAETRVNSITAGIQDSSSVAGLSEGGFVVTWSSGGAIKSQRFDAAGAPQGGEEPVNGAGAWSSVAALPLDAYVVTWAAPDAGGSGIHLQQYDGLTVGYQTSVGLKGRLSIADADAGSGSLTATLSVGFGVLEVIAGDSGTNVSGNGTASVTIEGTLAQLSALFGHGGTGTVAYSATGANPPGSAVLLTLTVTDNGNDGSGGALTDSSAYPIWISNVIHGTPFDDTLAGTTTRDLIDGIGGDDTIDGGLGDDWIDGGFGFDTAVFAGNAGAYAWSYLDGETEIEGPDGTDTLIGIERLQFDDGSYELRAPGFAAPVLASPGFGASAGSGGWDDGDLHPRSLADLDGDGRLDVIGFGAGGTYAAFGTADGTFGVPYLASAGFGSNPGSGGWTSQTTHPRMIGDVDGDGVPDIVGFGADGVYVSRGVNDGSFHAPQLATTHFGSSPSSGGWTDTGAAPRQLADLNGDGRDDILGFGAGGTYVALGNGSGAFAPTHLASSGFGSSAGSGGWTSQAAAPRLLGDIDGDGIEDLVGFAANGVYAALGDGTGYFGPAFLATNAFGSSVASGGWSDTEAYPRQLADLNDDGRADIIGFGPGGTYAALANADGTFAAPYLAHNGFGSSAGSGGWTGQTETPRLLADLDGDGALDVVGFAAAGVYAAYGDGAGSFEAPFLAHPGFGSSAGSGGWGDNDLHPRMLRDLNADGAADIVGFGEGGIVTAVSATDWVLV